MERSKLTEACLEGNLTVVKKQIAKRAPLDGKDGERYDDDTAGCVCGAPYYTPLGEAARMGHVEIVRALLAAGAKIDLVDYRNETPLILAAGADRPVCVEVLLEAGADPHHISSPGNALAVLQPGWRPGAIPIAKMLFARGVSPMATASYTRSAIERWLDQLPSRGKVEKKRAPALLEMLQLAAPHADKRAKDVAAAIARLEAQLGKKTAKAGTAGTGVKPSKQEARLAKLATSTTAAGWAADVTKLLGSIEKAKDRTVIEQVCKVVLVSPAAIANPKWPELITAVLARSQTYGDVTEEAYGKRLSLARMADDEGGAMDAYGDDHLYTFDWVLQMLAVPAAVAHAKWADLVLRVCSAKRKAVGDYSVCDEEIAALLAVAEAKAHARYGEVVVAAREACPYASCFGATGFLRDFKPAKPRV